MGAKLYVKKICSEHCISQLTTPAWISNREATLGSVASSWLQTVGKCVVLLLGSEV